MSKYIVGLKTLLLQGLLEPELYADFARVSSHLTDFNTHHKSLTAKLLQQRYRYHKLRKTFFFLNFIVDTLNWFSKYNTGLRSLLQQGLSEPEFYGGLVHKFRKVLGNTEFSDQFKNTIMRYKRIGYCDSLRAWWLTQSRITTLLSSLIVCRWVEVQTL